MRFASTALFCYNESSYGKKSESGLSDIDGQLTLFDGFKEKYDHVAHNSTIGKALAYSIHQEEYLRKFLSDGNIPMDNNYAEQAIRLFTIGRKNFIIIESDSGAKASGDDVRSLGNSKGKSGQYLSAFRTSSY